MRVAIIGGNLLGAATAFYTREALTANTDPTSTITVFEKLSTPGGKKFQTTSLPPSSPPIATGTAADIDLSSAPLLLALLSAAKIPLPPIAPREQWAVFDWDADEYKASSHRSFLLSALSVPPLAWLLHFLTLLSAFFFARLFLTTGLSALYTVSPKSLPAPNLPLLIWFFTTTILTFGLIPPQTLLPFYNTLHLAATARLSSHLSYGATTLSILSTLQTALQTHLTTIHIRNIPVSCISLAHLLTATDLLKYAKTSTPAFLARFPLHPTTQTDLISPFHALLHADSTLPPTRTNALSTLLALISRAPLPFSHRRNSRPLSADATATLIPAILTAARAHLRTNVEIRVVKSLPDHQYQLFALQDGVQVSHGIFDAVVLAAVVDPHTFSTDATDVPLERLLALKTSHAPNRGLNVARCVCLVRGALKASYVNCQTGDDVADRVIVLRSVNCMEILRVGEGLYRVVAATDGVVGAVFEEGAEVVCVQREGRKYFPQVVDDAYGDGVPEFIVAKRFLNAACVDRVACDVNLDCISARNTASFFREGVITWK